jgi:Ca2+-binding EF-hand superfamily protein
VQNSIEKVLKKLADGADNFSSMKEYCRYLIRKFDSD